MWVRALGVVWLWLLGGGRALAGGSRLWMTSRMVAPIVVTVVWARPVGARLVMPGVLTACG